MLKPCDPLQHKQSFVLVRYVQAQELALVKTKCGKSQWVGVGVLMQGPVLVF